MSNFIFSISSNVAIIESSPPKIPGVISLIPSLPEKGAIIFSFFNWAINWFFWTIKFLSNSKEQISSAFFILIEKDWLASAVTNVSIFS